MAEVKVDNGNQRLEWIDSIKGIAIIGIVLIHFGNLSGIFEGESNMFVEICRRGNRGVEIFYMVTGFLCLYKGVEKFQSIQNVFYYILKKVTRLIPLYWLAMLVNQLLLGIGGGTSTANIISHYLLLNFLNPVWWNSYFGGSGYVSLLALIYILQPIYLSRIKGTKKSGLFLCMVFGLRMLYSHCLRGSLSNDMAIAEFDYFASAAISVAMGYFVCEFVKEHKKANKKIVIAVLVVSLMALVGLFFKLPISVFAVLVGIASICLNYYKLPIIVNPIFGFLGKYSWAIFLFHITVYRLAEKFISPLVLLWAVAFLASVFIAVVLTKYYEEPILQWIKGMFYGHGRGSFLIIKKEAVLLNIIILIISIIVCSLLGGFLNLQQGFLPSTLGFFLSGAIGVPLSLLVEHFQLHELSPAFWWQSKVKHRDDEIYLSFSYLYRIELDGKYLLVRGHRLKNQYQPIGGVYKYYPGARPFLDSIHFRPNTRMGNTDETDDLRISVCGKYLLEFYGWFCKKVNREIDPKREFNEELLRTGLLDINEFENLIFTLHHVHDKGILKSEYNDGYEWIYSEIYTLQLNDAQKSAIRKALEEHSDQLILASAEELRNLRYNESVGRNLGNNCPWLIE